LSSVRYFLGFGNASGSQEKEHQSYRLIQLLISLELSQRERDLQAVEMEDSDMALPVSHALEERRYGLLIIGGGERGGEVETE
jgi:hypothetical protein